MNRRKVVAEMPSVRFDVCRGSGLPAKENAVAVGHTIQTRAVTRRRGGKRAHNQRDEADAAGLSGANEAGTNVDTTVMVLSAIDGREDMAQLTRRLAANVVAATGAPQRRQTVSKVDEELVSAQLRGNPTF